MKKGILFFMLTILLVSCTTKENEVLYRPWYNFSLLAEDPVSCHIDTVYMDGVTANRLSELPLLSGESIEVQETSIGYVYSRHNYISKEVEKTYMVVYSEKSIEILPIKRLHFLKVLNGLPSSNRFPFVPIESSILIPR